MATAKVIDGRAIVAYVGDVAVDSDGKPIEGAPKRPKDTDPSKQPGALGAPTPEERMGQAIATALTTAAKADNDDDDDDTLPAVDDLADHLSTLDIDEVKALRKRDKRKTAKRHYDARIAELEE